MTTEPDPRPADSDDVRAARLAIEAFLARTAAKGGGSHAGPADQDSEAGQEGRQTTGRVADRVAEQVAREAWDAVQDATPAAPDPETDAGPSEVNQSSPELAERHRQAVSIARGLLELGYPLDEVLRPGPDMAAG